ncbi:MAG: hypothetical protein GYB41_01480 [Oceanospirillales bacterium]|nr:hypothetical protein [Oceanospirillales bacterium]
MQPIKKGETCAFYAPCPRENAVLMALSGLIHTFLRNAPTITPMIGNPTNVTRYPVPASSNSSIGMFNSDAKQTKGKTMNNDAVKGTSEKEFKQLRRGYCDESSQLITLDIPILGLEQLKRS